MRRCSNGKSILKLSLASQHLFARAGFICPLGGCPRHRAELVGGHTLRETSWPPVDPEMGVEKEGAKQGFSLSGSIPA